MFKYKNLIEACIQGVVYKHNIIIYLRSIPEHAHIMVAFPKGINDEKALQLFKGGSRYVFFRNHSKGHLL